MEPDVPFARIIIVSLLVSLLSACTAPEQTLEPVTLQVQAGDLLFDHATVLGMLRLANDVDTDLNFLVEAVGLDNAPADSLLRHRQGPDRIDGTWDDDPFDDGFELSELVDVTADDLLRLAETAIELDLLPDLVIEGVPFTRAEVEATLLLANVASLGLLDGAVDSRAAQSLVLGRPYADVFEVAGQPRVGPSALESLRELAVEWIDTPEPAVED